ncbi:MAG: DNA-binding protein WhiA [Clostridia bacterium]|nr:DNA-binding protein WhiA [Clostridia bacterium]
MSFSSDVKTELISNSDNNACCNLAELSGMLALGGSLYLTRGGLGLRFASDNPAAARYAFSLVKLLTGEKCSVGAKKRSNMNQNTQYVLDVSDSEAAGIILESCGLITHTKDGREFLSGVPKELTENECCKRAYIRGAFLAGGTATEPTKAYSIELICANEPYAQSLCDFLKVYGLNAKTVQRKSVYVVYLKESESVIDFLSLAGASASVFKIENTRIMKDIRNNVNRAMNCETANFEKTSIAAQNQIDDINLIIDSGKFPTLNKGLRETAELRLEYPEATLQDLGDLHVPAQSKSCVNHRLSKLRKLAAELRGENDME